MFDGAFQNGDQIERSGVRAGTLLAADPFAVIARLEMQLERADRENQARIRHIEQRLDTLAQGVDGLRDGLSERQRRIELSVVDLADRLTRVEAAGRR